MEGQYADIFGHIHVLTRQLGESGGQGRVFRTTDPDIAVKLIHNDKKDDVLKDPSGNWRYTELRLQPVPHRVNLTLPRAELRDVAGYVMVLLDDMEEFGETFTSSDSGEGFSNPWLDGLKNKAPLVARFIGEFLATGGLRKRLLAYLGAAQILASLHARGLVYCDFSGKNCFISTAPNSDIVWLIDADNLAFAENISQDAVCTCEYAAPEVMLAQRFSPWSDCYSFAISLFRDLIGAHPFKGAMIEELVDEGEELEDIEDRMYRGEFPWIWDEDDDSNRGNSGFSGQRDMILTPRLSRLFERTFSAQGRAKRKLRPTMPEWFAALAEALDSLIRCPHCGMDFDISHDICPWCDTKPDIISLEACRGDIHLWTLTREIDETVDLPVPIRLIDGLRLSSYGKTACSIRCEKNGAQLLDLNPDYAWAVSLDGGKIFRDIYGRADILRSCLIRCRSADTGDAVIIKVN